MSTSQSTIHQDSAIYAKGLRKAYKIYASPIDRALESFRGGIRHTERVALDNVDLELKRGEVVGILGRNGAGKSTLLKIVAKTLEKTSGELDVNGRVTAILELGTGFHPEYSGRENIYMGGLCLGMTRSEIDAKIDEIIDFSELRDVIDDPFKTYSTGMQARLTFSTAISVDPDILIVDEALSVGDARFQMKCFAWLQDLREKDATILIVSHDTNTITTFCDRALILEDGKVYAEGDAKEVSELYQNMLFGRKSVNNNLEGLGAENSADGNDGNDEDQAGVDAANVPDGDIHQETARYGTGEAELLDWGLFNEAEERISVIETGSKVRFSMTLKCKTDIAGLSYGFAIKNTKGTVLWGITNLSYANKGTSALVGDTLNINAHCTLWLNAGDYFVTLGAAHVENGDKIDFVEDGIHFKVTGPGGIFTTSVVNLETSLDMESTREIDDEIVTSAIGGEKA